MIANTDTTIIEEVRSMKEANAAKYDFDVARIIQAARKRQETSGRRIIRQEHNPNSEQDADQPATAPELKPEGNSEPEPDSEARSQ